MKNTTLIGKEGERLAVGFLESTGFKIICKNYFTKHGEIDIVALKDRVIHFIEVKSGKNFDPAQNMTKAKIAKVIKSANIYLIANGITMPYCIDAILVREGDIEYIENITF